MQTEIVFKEASGFLTFDKELLQNGTRPYIPPRMRKIVIEQTHGTQLGVQAA